MFRLAGEMMRAQGFDFLFSGEVLGQRPMSQTKPSLRYVEKHSGMDGYILRPLSAKLLPETIPERRGLVDRERLLDIHGRGRKEQIALAKSFGVSDYPAPAGGCLLTDKGFSARLKDLFDHGSAGRQAEVEILKFGRHFRLNGRTKLAVGRTEKDNEALLRHHDPGRDAVLDVRDYPSPIGVLQGEADRESLMLAAAICIGYSRAPKLAPVEVVVKQPAGEEVLKAIAVLPEDVRKLMIGGAQLPAGG
jgi:tRNA U34 2-thiouridine synthase MnmA/TrmU